MYSFNYPLTFSAILPPVQKTKPPIIYNIPSVWVRTVSAKGMDSSTVVPPVIQHIGTKSPFKFSLFSVDSTEIFTPKVAQKHRLEDYNTLVFTTGNPYYLTRIFPDNGPEHLIPPPLLVKRNYARQSELPVGKPRTGRIYALMYKPQSNKPNVMLAEGYQKLTPHEAENNFIIEAKQVDIPDLPFLRLESLDLSKQKQPLSMKFPACPHPVLYVLATNPDDTNSNIIIRQDNGHSITTINRQQQVLLAPYTSHEVILNGEECGALLRVIDPK